MKDSTYTLTLTLLGLATIALAPLLVIWSLNTLFPALAIAYSMQTWAAVLIIMWTLKPTIDVKKS
jgi:hypothetical protein